MAVADHFDTVQKIYIAFYQRPADPAGLRYWAERVEVAGGDTGAVIDAFANSAEAEELYGDITNENIGEAVTAIYQALFGRAPDAAGLAYYEEAFANGELSAGTIALSILDGARGEDTIAINNKLEVANEFTQQVDGRDFDDANFGRGSNFAVTYDAEDTEAAREILADVTALPGTVLDANAVRAALQEQIANAGDPIQVPGAGNTFPLTNVIGEQVVGTAGADTFTAVLSSNGTVDNGTLNVGDTINGDAGEDTLNVLVADNVTALPSGVTVRNVETINFTYSNNGSIGDINSANFNGVQQIWQIDNVASAGAVPPAPPTSGAGSFANVTVGAGVTAGFRSTNVTDTAVAVNNVNVTAAAGVNTVSVALDGVATGSAINIAETTATNVSTVNVSGSVAAASTGPTVPGTLTLNTGATTDIDTLNLSLTSNANLTLGANFDNLETINASGSTGNIGAAATLFDLTANNELTSYVGSQGADRVSVDIDNAVSRTIDTGAGNDIVSLDGGFTGAANTNLDINLGTGNDTLIVNSATLTNVRVATEAAFESSIIEVSGFGNDDVLDLSALGARNTLTVIEQADITAADSLFAAVGVAATATDNTQYSVFQYDGSTYVYYDQGAAGFDAGDGLLELVGFTGTLTEGENFFA